MENTPDGDQETFRITKRHVKIAGYSCGVLAFGFLLFCVISVVIIAIIFNQYVDMLNEPLTPVN